MCIVGVTKTGNWALAGRLIKSAPQKLRASVKTSLRQEAELLRREIVNGITRQAPGGKAFKPLSPLTLAARRMMRFKGTKALIRRADLRNAIATIFRGDEVFIGVPNKARDKEGNPLIDVARLNEEGSDPIVIPISAKMRRFLFALYKEAGITPKPGARKGVVVTRIPPRPFISPAFEKFSKGIEKRFLARVAAHLGVGGRVK